VDLALFLLSAFGLTAILIEGKPTAPIRSLLRWIMGKEWGEYFISCYQCIGFWVSLALSVLFWRDWIHIALGAFAGSGVCWALGSWVKAQVSVSPFLEGEEGESVEERSEDIEDGKSFVKAVASAMALRIVDRILDRAMDEEMGEEEDEEGDADLPEFIRFTDEDEYICIDEEEEE